MKPQLSHADFRRENKRLWKTEIIRAAVAAFKKNGYHGTTMDDIANKLKITKGSLYYYFRNKEAILFDCHMASLDIVDKALEAVDSGDFTPREKIRSFVCSYLENMLEGLMGSVLLLEEKSLSPDLLKRIIRRRDRTEQFLRKILDEGMRTGEFRKADPKLLTFAILGAINWVPKWYDPAGEKGASEIARQFADYLVAGLLEDDSRSRESGRIE